jgi:hypothetical protein
MNTISPSPSLQLFDHEIVGECISHLTSGVILSKREELLPIILTAIRQHPESQVRGTNVIVSLSSPILTLSHSIYLSLSRLFMKQILQILHSPTSYSPHANFSYSLIDQLTRLMFNVMLRPTYEQRTMMICGCSSLAAAIGPIRTEVFIFSPECDGERDRRRERQMERETDAELLFNTCSDGAAPTMLGTSQ